MHYAQSELEGANSVFVKMTLSAVFETVPLPHIKLRGFTVGATSTKFFMQKPSDLNVGFKHYEQDSTLSIFTK